MNRSTETLLDREQRSNVVKFFTVSSVEGRRMIGT
jgi:hypothetical protein